jgi:hypothetical protein
MEIRKEQGQAEACPMDEKDLALINRLAKAKLTADQVYAFAVRLCDNEVDRDFERFDEPALSTLGDLFSGKTGIFDHRWSAEGQTARIYRTELVHEPGVKTKAGDDSCYLKGWAYLLRSEKNRDLIDEIEGGIKKEVSVGCSVARSVCSICGAESGTCEHVRGRTYGGKLCYAELREPTDAYEWSFVAVPAQRQAGVLKKFGGSRRENGGEEELLKAQARLGRNYLAALRKEVVRLAMLADDSLDGEVFSGITEKLGEPELLELQRAYGTRVRKLFPAEPQLRGRTVVAPSADESVFLV